MTSRHARIAAAQRLDRVHGSTALDLGAPTEVFYAVFDRPDGKSSRFRSPSPLTLVRWLRVQGYRGHELVSLSAAFGAETTVLYRKVEPVTRRRYTPGHYTGD